MPRDAPKKGRDDKDGIDDVVAEVQAGRAHSALKTVLSGAAFGSSRPSVEPDREHLQTSDRNLLDIGCNIGELAARCAARGILTMGIDALDEVIAYAVRRHKGKENLLFGICDLNPDSVGRLPRTDVTLCLSVHHYWHRSYGESACWQMLAAILDKTPKLMFEPASSHVRYGATSPSFVDMDEHSIDEYVFENFTRLVRDNRKVEKLGRTPSIRQESFRTIYLIS